MTRTRCLDRPAPAGQGPHAAADHLLHHDAYPRSSGYDATWIIENAMGPNVVWLTEALTQVMDIEAGMRILDLGCGRALSSIFLAREFGVEVWAVDVAVTAADNQRRVEDAGLSSSVYPVQAEAHRLPFPYRFFDAVVSLDAYHYFGTDELYIGYLGRFLGEGGRIGIVVPGVEDSVDGDEEARRRLALDWDWCAFHGPAWWRRHWERTGLVVVESADLIADGWRDWLRWNQVCDERRGRPPHPETELLASVDGRLLGFSRLVARKAELADNAWPWW